MTEDFRRALASAGLVYGGPLIPDGKLRRIKVEGDKEHNSWYVLHGDSPAAGAFGCWKRNIKDNWHHRNGKLSQADWEKVRERSQEAERERKRTEAEARAQARKTADRILKNSSPLSTHGYLTQKGVRAFGTVCAYKGTLVLPLSDIYGTLHTVQFINSDGTKRFLSGGRCVGAFYKIGTREDGPLVICEGYATGASIHEATDYQVACAMNAGNLLAVATAFRGKDPERDIIIAGDDDQQTKGNPGVTKSTEAAREIKARLVIPKFADTGDAGTDFNDLHKLGGIDEVRRQINAAEAAVETGAKRLFDLVSRQQRDPDELLESRYLCRGGGLLLVASTGVGKSVLLMQMLISWALRRECFGIRPARALSSLLIQAENDDGDLAEMRDGVMHGLRLPPGQIQEVRERILVIKEGVRTGADLVALIDTELATLKPDLLCLDPALAYLGGDALSQKDVGGFLRNNLNPVLQRHGCGCIIVHHGNKPPSGKDKSDWQGTDFAYAGSGSAEWANWARAVLVMRRRGSHAVYELQAGKRGSRLGWKDSDGNTSYARLIGHSTEPGFIYWRDASEAELCKGGRPKSHSEDDLLEILLPEGLITTEWQKLAQTECGIGKRRFYDLLKVLKGQERILKSKTNQKWQPILNDHELQ